MKLKVCFVDNWNPFQEYTATGVMPKVHRRIVDVELTKEQAAALTARRVGDLWVDDEKIRKDVRETIEWCQIEQ